MKTSFLNLYSHCNYFQLTKKESMPSFQKLYIAAVLLIHLSFTSETQCQHAEE